MGNICYICMETDGIIYTGYHNQCVFTVHRDCFNTWYITNKTCIICREPAIDVSFDRRFKATLIMTLTILSYGLAFYYLIITKN